MSDYKDVGVNVFLAGCKAGVREMLEKSDFYKKNKKEMLFLSVHDAVLSALERDPDLRAQVSLNS